MTLRNCCCLVILAVSAERWILRPQSAASPVAFVEKIAGEVTLRSGSDQFNLKPGIDAGRIIYSDETLMCGAGGQAVLRTAPDLQQARDVCKGAKMWPSRPRGETFAPIIADRSIKDLESRGKLGGGDKGIGDSPIYSPPSGGAILPRKFVVRWLTRPPLGSFTAILFDPDHQELARAAVVDGASGILDSGRFRDALMAYQTEHNLTREMTLVFRFASAPEQFVRFTVLTAAQRQQLESRLASLDPASGLFYRVERAAVYESFRMYDLVAVEYDAALVEAPDSRVLLGAALNANMRTGDKRRAHELSDKLAAIEDGARQ